MGLIVRGGWKMKVEGRNGRAVEAILMVLRPKNEGFV